MSEQGRELLKVTSFIVRNISGHFEVLLLRHPHAGIQFPAGTVDEGEDTATAAIREADEETGLTAFSSVLTAGMQVEELRE